MQVAEVKRSNTSAQQVQAKREPFFSKEREGRFFSKSNEASQSFFSPTPIQPKLTIGQPNDSYEKEADAVADKVVRRLTMGPIERSGSMAPKSEVERNSIQTKCASCEEEEKLQKKEKPLMAGITGIQRKPIFESNAENPEGEVQRKSEQHTADAPSTVMGKLMGSKGIGTRLEPRVQQSMGDGFGADFSGVRIHTGSHAVQMARDLNAQAFTHGSDIYFNQGKYDSSSATGKHLLAHELTHTVQQGAVLPGVQRVEKECRLNSTANQEPTTTRPISGVAIQKKANGIPINGRNTSTNSILGPFPFVHQAPAIQAKCAECEKQEDAGEEKLQKVQMKLTAAAADDATDPNNPNIQRRALEMEKTDYPIMFRKIPNLQLSGSTGSPDGSREAIVAEAQKMVGKIEAKKDDGSGRRVGADQLLEIFRLGAKDAWPDHVIETSGKEGFPHWCGIFTVYAIKKAGIDLGFWQVGKGVSSFGTLQETENPLPGDIGYFELHQHHCIIKAVHGDTIDTIDGNSGNFSEVKEKTRNKSEFLAFFTPFTGAEKYLQKKEAASADTVSANGLEDRLNGSSGRGEPLAAKTRSQMESGFGTDFGGVNIHTDSKAAELSNDLGAQAFTHGNDIYFNQGKYNPESASGKHLLAHELTHTVQQGASSINTSLQMKSTEEEVVDATKLPLEKGQMNAAKTEITFDKIGVPGFKLKDQRGNLYTSKALKRMKGYNDEIRPSYKSYKKNWLEGITGNSIKNEIKKKLKSDFKTDADTYVFKAALSKSKSITDAYYFGKLDEIVEQLKIPNWGGKSNPSFKKMTLDHIVELQLANWNTEKWSNEIENLELVEEQININSGGVIKETINRKINEFNKATKNQFTDDSKGIIGQQSAIKNKYNLIFKEAVKTTISGAKVTISTTDYWTKKQIEDSEHLGVVENAHLNELDKEGEVKIFPKPGVRPKTFKWKQGMEEDISADEKNWFGNQIIVTYKKFDTESKGDELGHVRVNADKVAFLEKYSLKYNGKDVVIPIQRLEGTRGVGYVAKESANHHLLEWFKEMSFNPFSPIRIDNIDFGNDGMLVVEGKIVPDLPVIKDAEIDFRMESGEVQIFKEFTGPQIKLPKPFSIHNTTLSIYADTRKGLGITGAIDFEIEKLAQGHMEADLSQKAFVLSGDLNFESKWFDPAKLSASYVKSFGETSGSVTNEPKWDVNGELGLKKDIKGIKKLLLKACYDGTLFCAVGNIEFDIPGIESGIIKASYNNETKDFGIAGEFNLTKDIPGINGGCVAASLTRNGATGEYSLGIIGSAQPNIPGLDNANLCISYKDGVFEIQGVADFKKGIAFGKVKIGATNQLLDKEGKPTGGASKKLIAYGSGTITVRFSEFLEGTVGARLTKEGKIMLAGEIKIPEKIPLTKAKDEFNKTIVPFPTISIPIIGISAMGKTVGIAAKISGGVDAYASMGPLSLTELYLKLKEFDPMEPSTAEVEGGAAIDYPAKAGIKVRMNVGVVLSILIVEAGGELIGSLALELNGNAGGNIKIKWTPNKGLEFIEAKASVKATAQMIMSLKGRLYVDLDLLLKTINLWEQETTLAERKFGPGLAIGITVPLKVEDGKLKGINFEDIEYEKPDFSDGAKRDKMLSDAMDESKKPAKPDPPSREEAIKIIRRLPAKASEGINVFNFNGERYSYIFKLKAQYPEQDWSFIPEEVKKIENEELYSFRQEVFNFKKNILGMSLVESRLMVVRTFEENHPTVDSTLLDILKQEVKDVGNNA